MALERWLLEKANRGDPDVEAILVDLLRRSNNVALTAVVASVVTAHPDRAAEAAVSLLTSPFFLKVDLSRAASEPLQAAQMAAITFPECDAEKSTYRKERTESDKLPHRQQSLEDLAINLQVSPLRERVWALIDGYRTDLPPEAEQDETTKRWRLRLHMIDIRNFVETGSAPDGRVFMQASVPPADLQKIVEEQKPRSAVVHAAMSLFAWGRFVLQPGGGEDADPEDWPGRLNAAKKQMATSDDDVDATVAIIRRSGSAYVAAVCIRDHWEEMSPADQDWCAVLICNAVEADADTRDHFAVAGRNPVEASRPAAFILPALFGKALPSTSQARLLPALAKSVIHAVEETVNCAVQGLAHFLWKTDRSLALTCVQALVTKALETHAFLERQRKLPPGEQQDEETAVKALRSRLRRFIGERGDCDESALLHLDLTTWPGRGVARHLLTVLGQQPTDSLTIECIRGIIAILPTKWEEGQRSRRTRLTHDAECLDPDVEQLFVRAICRVVLRLEPEAALRHLEPIFNAAARFPEKAADFVNCLILAQGNRVPAPTLWVLWQRFADDFASGELSAEVDDERSDAGRLLGELFLGVNWGDTRDWPPLAGEAHRLKALIERLPPTQCGFESYSHFLAKPGSQSLPEPLVSVASKLNITSGTPVLNETAVFYLEQILTRLIYGGNSRIRTEPGLRTAALTILDHLVEAGSSPAYKLQDDFLTPTPA